MDIREFKNKVFQKADEEGFTSYEIYYKKSDDFSVKIYKKEVDKYSVSNGLGLSFRGIYNGKMGYSYTEILDEDAVNMLVLNARDNAISVDSDDKEFIYDGKDNYEKVEAYNSKLAQVQAEQKINLALKLEKTINTKSDKIVNIEYCGIESEEGELCIINSNGIDVSFKSNIIFAAGVPIVKEGERMYDGMEFICCNDIEKLNIEAIAEKSVKDAISKIGATSIKSGKYKIAIRNDAAASLLQTFASIFNAENGQKGFSLLKKDKIGDQIATDIITIVDNPLIKGGLCSAPFDAEGVATYKKCVIEKGKLKNLLYNLKTANKDGVKTTGNASKVSYSSPITTAPFNFYIEAGEINFEDILKTIGEGLLITEFQGMHAGANSITGDFSLAAKGFVIKNGKLDRPVEQITVSDNFYNLLKNVELVGNDTKFGFPSAVGYFGSPTLMVKEMSIAGE